MVLKSALPLLLGGALLTSCNGPSTAPTNNAQSTSALNSTQSLSTGASGTNGASQVDVDAANHRMLAAAEPFENLTEAAFSAKPAQLKRLIEAAQSAASSVMPSLSGTAPHSLQKQLSAINSAQASGDRAGVALSAVEGYRTLVSNTSGKLIVPQQVSLLDYAGFRTQADLKASPKRWADAPQAVAFGRARWQEIAGQVKDQALANDMAGTLSSMDQAARSKNAPQLMKGSTHELDLVDKLESYFTKAAGA